LGERVDINTCGFDEKSQPTVNSTSLIYTKLKTTTQVKTDKGHVYAADLVFMAGGTLPNNAALTHHFASRLASNGRIEVNNYLQIEVKRSSVTSSAPTPTQSNNTQFFALGDISNADKDKMAYHAGLQAAVVIHNIKVLASKDKGGKLKPYAKVEYPAGFITVGRDGGMGQMPNKKGTIVGDFLVKTLKAKDFMISKAQGNLNQKFDSKRGGYDAVLSPAHRNRHRMSMRSAFKMDDEQLEQFERDIASSDSGTTDSTTPTTSSSSSSSTFSASSVTTSLAETSASPISGT